MNVEPVSLRTVIAGTRSLGSAVVAIEQHLDGASHREVVYLARQLNVRPARGRANTIERITRQLATPALAAQALGGAR